jgi:hypothetical protein
LPRAADVSPATGLVFICIIMRIMDEVVSKKKAFFLVGPEKIVVGAQVLHFPESS